MTQKTQPNTQSEGINLYSFTLDASGVVQGVDDALLDEVAAG